MRGRPAGRLSIRAMSGAAKRIFTASMSPAPIPISVNTIRPTGWSGPSSSLRKGNRGAGPTPLEEDPADQLHLQFARMRAQPTPDPLAAIAVDMRYLPAEATPA